jgi:probable HAF family extracellular repeat protein
MALLWCAIVMLFAGTGPLAQQRPLPVYRIVDLGTLGGDSSEASGINLLGDVVGTAVLANGKPRAFLYRAGRMVDLGTLTGGTESYAAAIADNGVIVGYSGINDYPYIPEFKYQGFIWQEGTMRSVGSLYCYCSVSRRYGTSRTLAVNNAGIAVGSTLAGGFGTPTHPGDVSSEARALNIQTDVVGRSGNGDLSTSRAMLWRGSMAVDLHTAVSDNSWTLQVATGINNTGQIVGTGRHNGQTRAFLLQP